MASHDATMRARRGSVGKTARQQREYRAGEEPFSQLSREVRHSGNGEVPSPADLGAIKTSGRASVEHLTETGVASGFCGFMPGRNSPQRTCAARPTAQRRSHRLWYLTTRQTFPSRQKALILLWFLHSEVVGLAYPTTRQRRTVRSGLSGGCRVAHPTRIIDENPHLERVFACPDPLVGLSDE